MRALIILLFAGFIELQGLIWTPAQVIETTTNDLTDNPLGLAVDSFGNAVAIWREALSSPVNSVISVASLPFQGTWTASQTISTAGVTATSPVVAVNASGYAVAAWLENTGGGNIRVSVSTRPLSTGIWSSLQYSASSSYVGPLAIVVDSSGNAMITATTGGVVRAFRLPFGGSLSSGTTISSGTQNNNGSLAIDGSGNIRGVWENNALPGIDTNLYTGGVWSGIHTIVISANIATDANPSVVLDTAGNATTVWFESQNLPVGSIRAATLAFGGGSWSSAATVFTNAHLNDVAVDMTGGRVIAVADYVSDQANNLIIVQASILPLGGSWSSPQNLTGQETLPTAGGTSPAPSITVDPAGNAYALWVSQSGINTFYAQTATLLSGSSTWLTPFTIYTVKDANTVFDPLIASGIANNAVAIGVIDYTSYQTLIGSQGTLIVPPSNLKGNQLLHRFPTQGDLINNMVWTSPNPYTVDHYNIYRDYIPNLIGSVDIPMFQDHQRTPGVSSTYFVTSVNPAGEESSSISITLP